MSARFTVLASSSSGNSSLLDVAGRGLLIDCGLGPRKMTRALDEVGRSWDDLHDVLLTHIHGDHWNELVLRRLARSDAVLWCHAEHAAYLHAESSAFLELEEAERVRFFEVGQPFRVGDCQVTAFVLWHDSFTCGFRVEGIDVPWAVGFASDLGAWSEEVANYLSEVDVLALEFNHDVVMQQTSGRSPWLIRRNLSRDGHLSNAQAARLLDRILESSRDRLRRLIPMHLSRQCNRPELVVASAEPVRKRHGADFSILAARADGPLEWTELGTPIALRAKRGKVIRVGRYQPLFDGWD